MVHFPGVHQLRTFGQLGRGHFREEDATEPLSVFGSFDDVRADGRDVADGASPRP